MVENAKIEAMLAEILLKPENRILAPKRNVGKSKIQVTDDDWNPASHSGYFFVIPVRNKKCTKDSCTYEVNQIVKQFLREKVTSSASNYKCASCSAERSVKDLSIDLTITGVASKLRNARYDQLISDGKIEGDEEFQLSDGMHVRVEKGSLLEAIDKGQVILKDGAPLFRSFMLLQDAEDGLRRIKPELKSALTAANSDISKVLSNTKENFELFKDIFGGENPFESNLAFSELKEGLGIFEFTEQRFDPKQLKNKEITFLLRNEMLNIHYPGLGLTFVDVKLTRKNGDLFPIPPGAKLSTFIDKTEMTTKILITGGVNITGKAISTNYEVSFTPYTEGGRIVLKQAIVEEKNAMKKPKYCHSIVWHPKNEQIYIIGGVGDPRGPTASVEVGEREKGDWVWFSAKELLKPRICGSACVAGEYIYIFGGYVKKNLDDYPRIGDGPKFPVQEIERLNLTNNKSEMITELKVEMPAYYICFPNSFEKPEEIIFLGGKDQNVCSFNVTKNQMVDEKAKIGDLAPPDGNQGWTIYMSQVITMVPTVGKGFKLLKYDLSNKYIQYTDLKI